MFTTYASEQFEVLRAHLPDVHTQADDTQLYLSFKPNSDVNQHDAITATELYVKPKYWILAEKLNLNDDNTELFQIIGTRQQLAKVKVSHLPIVNIRVQLQLMLQGTEEHGSIRTRVFIF